MKCWNNTKYSLFYLIYIILAVWFYIGQNSGETPNACSSFSEFAEQVLYRETGLIRVILLPPLCILIFLHIQYFFGEQFVIRQKNRKQIYLKLLWTCFVEALLFSIFFCLHFILYWNYIRLAKQTGDWKGSWRIACYDIFYFSLYDSNSGFSCLDNTEQNSSSCFDMSVWVL